MKTIQINWLNFRERRVSFDDIEERKDHPPQPEKDEEDVAHRFQRI